MKLFDLLWLLCLIAGIVIAALVIRFDEGD